MNTDVYSSEIEQITSWK